ncbi:MAG: radical SAM protein, partial [Candidatus Tectomicrobia bacterium]|nr:radical SAM protein [Candidatus Tectomicrobia bacterium]
IDLVALRMKDFPELLAEAGCTQVFQGMESVNPDTLKSAGKPQNHVQEYNKTMAALRKLGILSHVGYMIGFPNETPESIARDIQILMNEVQPDIASFFIVTPIPGSEDHFVARQRGTVLSADYNDFDSFHQVGPHAGFPEASLEQVYRQAWATFYSYDNMKAILQRSSPKTYWNIFRNFIWYKHSYSVEDTHPMIAGFFRLKGRKSRRPIFKTEPMVVYYPRRALEISYDMWQRVKFLREMRRLWLETRSPTELEKKLTSHIETFRQEIAEHLHTVQGGLTYSQSHCQAFLEKGQGWLDLLKAMEAEWGQRSLQFPGKFLKGLRLKTEQAMETLHSVEATLRQGVGTPRLEERYRQALTSLAKKYEEALHYASNIKRQNSIVETFQFIRLLLKTREKEVVY